jgi:hypothetical protein
MLDIQESLGMMVAEIAGLASQPTAPNTVPSHATPAMTTLNQPVPTQFAAPDDEEDAPTAPQAPIRNNDY